MIVYLEDKAKFRADVLSNRIEEKIQESFRKLHGHRVDQSELASWKNSLGFIDRVLSDDDIPSDAGVAVEYGLPGSGKRIDVMITGTNDRHQRSAVIIELKQWSEAAVTTKDAIVSTFIGGAHRELSHPSYQAWSYAVLPTQTANLKNHLSTFTPDSNPISLFVPSLFTFPSTPRTLRRPPRIVYRPNLRQFDEPPHPQRSLVPLPRQPRR